MDKLNKERNILSLAEPILERIYGKFTVDEKQFDSPDAAIITDKGILKKIGIEITSVDKQDAQQYLNDERIAREVKSKQIKSLLSDGEYSNQPTKKLEIHFPYNYIYDGVIKKSNKYDKYVNSGDYHEIIIIAFSEYLTTDLIHFEDYYIPHTDYLLSKKSFPFSKVIFVSIRNRKSVLIYDRDNPCETAQEIDENKELSITTIAGPTLPVGESVNINSIFEQEPSIPYRTKNEQKKRRKDKRKKQRKSRKQQTKK